MKLNKYFLLLLTFFAGVPGFLYPAPAPILFDYSYEHDRWVTLPRDIQLDFAAYTVSFDSEDDNDGDGRGDIWGIPEWVSFEIKRLTVDHPLSSRPRWMTDNNLYAMGLAPNDESYRVPGTTAMREVKTDYRFVRGHLCPKDTAERISRDAAYNTHILVNVVPQLQWQNNGIWKVIEQLSTEWADRYNRVWVITGPVFFNANPALWLGQDDEMKVAVPDALFKIIVREDPKEIVKTITFLIPNIVPKTKDNPELFITTIDRIEELTSLDFLTILGDKQEKIENLKGFLSEWEKL